jgi:hypothetical protein
MHSFTSPDGLGVVSRRLLPFTRLYSVHIMAGQRHILSQTDLSVRGHYRKKANVTVGGTAPGSIPFSPLTVGFGSELAIQFETI